MASCEAAHTRTGSCTANVDMHMFRVMLLKQSKRPEGKQGFDTKFLHGLDTTAALLRGLGGPVSLPLPEGSHVPTRVQVYAITHRFRPAVAGELMSDRSAGGNTCGSGNVSASSYGCVHVSWIHP